MRGSSVDASASMHLSLSLSLYPRFNPCNGAGFGALDDLLAGPRRAPLGRGISIAWRRPAPARQLARARVYVHALSGRRGASRSRTQEATCAAHTSDRGRRYAPPIVVLKLGRSPVNPWGAVKGAQIGPSPVWLPWRCRPFPCGLVASEQSPACAPTRAGRRSGRRGPTDPSGPRRSFFFTVCVQGGEGQADQGRRERGVRRTRATEDAEMRRPSPSWGGGC